MCVCDCLISRTTNGQHQVAVDVLRGIRHVFWYKELAGHSLCLSVHTCRKCRRWQPLMVCHSLTGLEPLQWSQALSPDSSGLIVHTQRVCVRVCVCAMPVAQVIDSRYQD